MNSRFLYRYFNFTNVSMTTFAGTTKQPSEIVSSIFMRFAERPYQKSFIKFVNFTIYDMVNEALSPLDATFGSYTDMEMTGTKFINLTSTLPIINIGRSKTKLVDGVSITNCTVTSSPVMLLASTGVANISNISIEGLKVEDNIVKNNLVQLTLTSGGTMTAKNFTVRNSEISKSLSILHFTSTAGSMELSNLIFENLKLDDAVAAMNLVAFSTAKVTSVVFKDITQVVPNDVSNTLIDLTAIASTSNSNITFDGVTVENSSVSLLRLSNTLQSKDISQYFKFKNVVYKDSSFQYSDSLISTLNLKSNSVFSLTFSDLKFQNITFARNGNLLLLSHQVAEQLEINNAVFSGIKFAGISIEAFDKNEIEKKTKVKMTNVTAYEVDGYFRSFLVLNEGAELEMRDSRFYYVSNLESGAVLYGGKISWRGFNNLMVLIFELD